MKQRSFNDIGIIVNRRNIWETDRLVTILTKNFGKITVVAKGVRKMKSKNRANLEPGNIIKGFFIITKSMPLLTQSSLIEDASEVKKNLTNISQLQQFLEIIDKLFVEEEIPDDIFHLILKIRGSITNFHHRNVITNDLCQLITKLGFQNPRNTKFKSILNYVSALSEKKVNSYNFLKI